MCVLSINNIVSLSTLVTLSLRYLCAERSISKCSECGQLCLLSRQSIQCDCTAGYNLSPDGHSCYSSDRKCDVNNMGQLHETSFTILAFQLILSLSVKVDGFLRGIVISSSLDGLQQQQLVDSSLGISQTPITGLNFQAVRFHPYKKTHDFTGLIFAIAFDISTNSIFFGDRNSSTIWMVSAKRLTDFQDNRVQLAENVHVWGMTYDWICKTLYWTDDRWVFDWSH